jgi:growth factor-regulated tyrosine kinase substrate
LTARSVILVWLKIEKATSEDNIIGSDLSHFYFEISDEIKSKQIPAKTAIATLKKRLLHKNPNVVLFTLDVRNIIKR